MKRTSHYTITKDKTIFVYTITKSDGDKRGGWYTQTSSISSFCERLLNRWDDKHKNSVDSILLLDSIRGIDDLYDEVVRLEFNSVWDFYDFIGYNHKDKTLKTLDNLIQNWKYK